MQNLRFGTTARRKALRRQRRRRIALGLWGLATVAVLAGWPLARLTVVPLIDRLGPENVEAAAASGTTVAVHPGATLEPSPEAGAHVPPRFALSKKARSANDQAEGATTATDAYAGASVTEIIETAAAEFGIDPGYLISIAECESGLDPQAYNSAGYHGLFQYDDTTWSAYGYGSIWDPVAQARTTAELIADGQASRWPNCA